MTNGLFLKSGASFSFRLGHVERTARNTRSFTHSRDRRALKVSDLHTVETESIVARLAGGEVGHELAEPALDGTGRDLRVIGLGARVVDRRPVGDGEPGPVAGEVLAVADGRQLARARYALGRLGVRVDELAEAAAVQLGALHDEARRAPEHGRLVVRDLRVGRDHLAVVLERRVLDVRHGAGNCWTRRQSYASG